MLFLDSSAVSRLAERTRISAAFITVLHREGLWPPAVPTFVLVECLRGDSRRDAVTNRFLKTCDITEEIPETVARRAARLRTLAKRGSAVDATLVAAAEPEGTVLTSDVRDLRALAAHSQGVRIERV